jgi:hypothetical protein
VNLSSSIQRSYKFLPNRRKVICNQQRSATPTRRRSCRKAYMVAKIANVKTVMQY